MPRPHGKPVAGAGQQFSSGDAAVIMFHGMIPVVADGRSHPAPIERRSPWHHVFDKFLISSSGTLTACTCGSPLRLELKITHLRSGVR